MNRTGPTRFPTSYYQRDWVLACHEGRSSYSLPLAWQLHGALDRRALSRALELLTARHDALRTAFQRRNDDVDQVVWPSVAVELHHVDLSTQPAPDDATQARIVADAQRTRLLDTPPLWHGLLIRLAPQHHVLALFVHHLIFDGWSHGVLHDELVRCYRAAVSGRPPNLPDLRLQLGDHAAWERGRRDPVLERWWAQRLRDLPPLGEIPPVGGRFISAPLPTLGAARTEELQTLAARHGGGLNTALLAAVLAARRGVTGDDVVVGVTRAGRARPRLHRVVGPLLDHVPVRVDLSGTHGSADLLRRVALAYREATSRPLPLGRVRQVVPDDLTPRGNRIFDTRYNYLPAATARAGSIVAPGGDELRVAAYPIDPLRLAPRHTEDHPEVLPLSYVLRRTPDGALGGEVCGHDGVFPADRLAELADDVGATLARFVGLPVRSARRVGAG